ncbi:hypothetical protein ABIC78_004097 [Novosphingobium sp. 1529]
MDGLPEAELHLETAGGFEDRATVMDVSVLGMDLSMHSCSVVCLDATGKAVVRRRMR